MAILAADKGTDIIAVMGATGTGKTTFINLVSNSTLRVGSGLHSCTSDVVTTAPFPFHDRKVVLIDTPGFDDTTKSDTAILELISKFLSEQYSAGTKLAGIIYMHRISDFRMGGISRLNFRMFRELCGDKTLKNVAIVTNMWGEVSREIGEARELELAGNDLFFKPVLDKQAKLARHQNNLKSAHSILQLLVGNNPEVLQIQRQIVDEGKGISQTAAAEVLNHELIEQARKLQEEKDRVQAELEASIKQQAEEAKRAREAEQRRVQEEIARAEAEVLRQAEEHRAEQARIEREMHEAAEQARIEAERIAAEHQQKLREEAERARQQEIAEAAERARIEAVMRQQAEERRLAQEQEQRRMQEAQAWAQEEARRQAEAQRAERARIEWEMAQAAERAREEAERVAARYQQRMWEEAEANRRRQEAEANERAELARQLAEAQRRQAELDEERRRSHRHDSGPCIIM